MSVQRLPRKLKKQLKKLGLNPKDPSLNPKEAIERDKHLKKMFYRDYENAHEIVQEIIGVDECILQWKF